MLCFTEHSTGYVCVRIVAPEATWARGEKHSPSNRGAMTEGPFHKQRQSPTPLQKASYEQSHIFMLPDFFKDIIHIP